MRRRQFAARRGQRGHPETRTGATGCQIGSSRGADPPRRRRNSWPPASSRALNHLGMVSERPLPTRSGRARVGSTRGAVIPQRPTKGRHFDGLVSTLSGYPCSLAGTQEFWIGRWLGLASDPAGKRHDRFWPARGKHGHDAECPHLVPNGAALSRARRPCASRAASTARSASKACAAFRASCTASRRAFSAAASACSKRARSSAAWASARSLPCSAATALASIMTIRPRSVSTSRSSRSARAVVAASWSRSAETASSSAANPRTSKSVSMGPAI